MSAGRIAHKRAALEVRAKVVHTLREYLHSGAFVEVHTPVRTRAPAPEAHIDAIGCEDGYLRTSPELEMKRMLAGGFTKIYQLGSCFRAGERGRRHLPEFTMLEWYRRGADYTELMQDCRDMVIAVAEKLGVADAFSYQGVAVDLPGPWEDITVEEAYRKYAGVSAFQSVDELNFDEHMVNHVEPKLGHPMPTILRDYPAKLGALARLKPGDPRVAERFELYIAGVELANGFSELCDAAEQRERFEAEEALRRERGMKPYPAPDKFLKSLESLEGAAGIALGVDRLVMLMCDAAEIDEVVAFTPEEL